MDNDYYPNAEDYQSQISTLDSLIERQLQAGQAPNLVRLNTYLRRYLSPLVTHELFRQNKLDLLLQQQEIGTITALILDIRGFVRTTKSGEQTSRGLDEVARLLRRFFADIIRISFEHRGLVGELAGDRVLITFGYPPASVIDAANPAGDLALNVGRAVSTAFAIQRMSETLKQDASFPASLRQFEVGIGICAGGPAWFGNIGQDGDPSSWRQELMIISTAVNIAARAEEMTKDEILLKAAPEKKIIVNDLVVEQIQTLVGPEAYTTNDLGVIKVRGIEEGVHLYQFIDLAAGTLPAPEPITPQDRRRVEWLCKHIDGALERQSMSSIHRTISDVGQLIVSNPLPDEAAVFSQIMEQIMQSFSAEKATLYQVDPAAQMLMVMSSTGSNPLPYGLRMPLGTGIASWVARNGQDVIIRNVHEDPRWAGGQHDPSIHAMMCSPLRVGDQVVGVIQLMDETAGAFQESNLVTLKMFAGLATLALKNARSYERARRITEARLLITQAFSNAITLDEVLDAVMDAIESTLEARNATLYAIDDETGELIFRKIISDSEAPPRPGLRLQPGTGIVGWVINNRCGLLIHDTHRLQSEPNYDLDQWLDANTDILILDGYPRTSRVPYWYRQIDPNIHAIICVPLIAKGQTVGAIQVLSQQPHAFDDEHLEILQWLSASAAVAMENAAQIEQARRKLVAADTIAGMGAIAGKLAHNLKNYVSGIRAIAQYELQEAQGEESAELIDEIVEAADLALAEVESFMQPLTDWEVRQVDVTQIMHEQLSQVRLGLQERQAAKPRIDLVLKLADQPLIVEGGRAQIQYIFRNLIDNAIRAIDETGNPSGTIEVVEKLDYVHELPWVVVTVSDTGTGISPENLGRLFELFFTTRPEGTIGGYGLFWVRLNVERLGGRITASSTAGSGATFEVRLPKVINP